VVWCGAPCGCPWWVSVVGVYYRYPSIFITLLGGSTGNMHEEHPEFPNRRSTRLPSYDYTSAGAYFITICVENRKRLFDQPELQQCLLTIWQNLPKQFPGITLDEFVIMPDHIHFIIWLNGTGENPLLLSQVVGAYKSLTTVAWIKYNKARDTVCSQHLWQTRYYDHIIRNDEDLELTRQYIRDNPRRKQEG